jgi:N-acetylglucosamine repressor
MASIMNATKLAADPNLSGNDLKKFRQKKSMLRILYKYRTIAVPELSKHLGISMPTTFLLLNDLIAEELVEIHGTGVSTGGRKPSLYSLSDKSLFVIACDMGRYQTKMTIYNVHNQQVTPITTIETHIDDDLLVQKLFDAAEKLIAENQIPKEKIIGLGVDMPGLVDAHLGINYTIKNAAHREIRNQLRDKFSRMVYVDNDARMQAFGEYTFGKAKGCRNAIIINWSWGLGLGMILNDALYGGTTGFAGEFSHIQMVDDGDLCICGKRGCLETVASSTTILKLALEGVKEGKITQLTRHYEKNHGNLTPEDVIAAARSGDEFSISILNKIGIMFGKGISYLIHLLNPEIIVLGGSIAKANQFVLTPIQQALNRYCLEQILQGTRVVISDIDEQSGLLGTSAMLFQYFLNEHQTL